MGFGFGLVFAQKPKTKKREGKDKPDKLHFFLFEGETPSGGVWLIKGLKVSLESKKPPSHTHTYTWAVSNSKGGKIV